MPRKTFKRSRGQNRRPSRGMHMIYPTTVIVKEGSTVNISLSQLQGACPNFTGAPWRLRSVVAEALVTDSKRDSGISSAIVQIRLNSALATNVESISSRRWLVSSTQVRKFTIRAFNPNPWKEDEEINQDLISVDNIALSSALNSIVTVYLTAYVEYKPLIFTPRRSFPILRSHEEEQSSGDEGSSLSEKFSRLSC